MSLPALAESVDTNRVNTFFIWKEIYKSFSEKFMQESFSVVNGGIPDQANEYLKRLKRYSSNANEHDYYWKTLSELMEFMELPNGVDQLRDLYKKIKQFDRIVEEEMIKLKRMPNLDNVSADQIRVHEFIDGVMPFRTAFDKERSELLKHVQIDLFKSLQRSDMELRLLESVNHQFQYLLNDMTSVFHAMSEVENGHMYRLDVTYSQYQTDIYTLLDKVNAFKVTANVVADTQLNVAIFYVAETVQKLIDLGLKIPQQPSYNIETFKSGHVASDVFEVVKKINRSIEELKMCFSVFESRIIVLMSDIPFNEKNTDMDI